MRSVITLKRLHSKEPGPFSIEKYDKSVTWMYKVDLKCDKFYTVQSSQGSRFQKAIP